jgi:uncharacterized protein (DUF952 family)
MVPPLPLILLYLLNLCAASIMIYHITSKNEWLTQKGADTFRAFTLTIEGFIHCCEVDQVEGVLQRYFGGQKDLVLLEIDERKVSSELKYEKGGNGEMFPHIYGPIDIKAIIWSMEVK